MQVDLRRGPGQRGLLMGTRFAREVVVDERLYPVGVFLQLGAPPDAPQILDTFTSFDSTKISKVKWTGCAFAEVTS
jgi:hypothetical protein